MRPPKIRPEIEKIPPVVGRFGWSARVYTGGVCFDIAGGTTYTRKQACLKAAERLKELARQFEVLAGSKDE